jgi:hypothetical protein
MKSKDIFWGVVLVGIGLMFLLRNFNIIYFDWYMFRTLWPVLIILLGVALLPINGLVRIVLAFLIVGGSIIYISVKQPESSDFFSFPKKYGWDWDDKHHKRSDTKWSEQLLYESYAPSTQNAVLELDAIAGEFKVESTDDYLVKFEKVGDLGEYRLSTEEAGNSVILRLSMKDQKIRRMNRANKATIGLNPNPLWDIKLDAGAAKIDFDLEPFKVDRIEIDGGAASVKLRLGDLHDNTNLRVEAGAASVVIEIPENSGCEIYASTVLSSKSFRGFIDEGNNYHRTENFDSAANKIFIRIDAAVSSFKVVRY